MTILETPPATTSGPTARSVTRSARAPILVAVVLALVVGLLAFVGGSRATGTLDPRAYDPSGAHAVAALLADRGTNVRVVDLVGDALAAASTASTLVLPFPEALTEGELTQLRRSPGRLVLIGAGQASVDALGLNLKASAASSRPRTLEPGCALAAAQLAGPARMGGTGYVGAGGTGCYASAGRSSLYATGAFLLLGSGEFLTNAHLDEDGNAALALGVLAPAAQSSVLWLLPRVGRDLGAEQQRGLGELLPEWFLEALVMGSVSVLLLALWRARRLGRVAVEPLPVVVRAAEIVEGRGRLYRQAGARDRAAENLRAASRDLAARRLALGATGSREALLRAAADRTRRPPRELEALLYGPDPVDDAALVRLADALSHFDEELTGT